MKFGLLAATAIAVLAPSLVNAQATIKYRTSKLPPALAPDPGQTFGPDSNGISAPLINQGAIQFAFEGISQYDVASVQRNFIPPDTIGAAGRTQYMQFTNGGVAVFDKATGSRTFTSDTAFWNNVAGQAGVPNGDQRVIYNAQANKWLAISFGPDTKDLLIAVSNTSDALGGWKSTKFEGFAPLAAGARTLADYPTLAFDNNAVYIGTNDFAASAIGGPTNFRGTTLNVIPIADIFGKAGPSTANNVQFRTAFDSANPNNDFSRGFAIQGVNSRESGDGTGHIIAASINDFGLTRYDVLNAGTAGATRTATTSTLIGTDYTFNSPARQPSVATPANQRVIDSFGDQISSSAFENDGKIYSVHTVTENGTDFTSARVTVLDTATDQVIQEFNIGGGGFDVYQGALAVNALGQVVVSFNRSSLDPTDGKITLAAFTFNTNATTGQLVQSSAGEIVLRVSDTDDYHNGSLFGAVAAGRQRWADYASVTTDPTDIHNFWITGSFAREYNLPQFGHPGGTGGSRWGTFIANLNVGSVPEPGTWAMLIIGFGFVGAAARRRAAGFATA